MWSSCLIFLNVLTCFTSSWLTLETSYLCKQNIEWNVEFIRIVLITQAIFFLFLFSFFDESDDTVSIFQVRASSASEMMRSYN